MTQTIFRPARRAQYTVVSNALMNDERISADALGALVYLLSRPDDWVIHREQLMSRFKIGRDKFQSIFRELSVLGYARLESVSDAESGHLAGKRWVIIEEPDACDRETENPSLGDAADERVSRQSAKPTVGKPGHIINTDLRPITESQPKTVSPPTPNVTREGGKGLSDDGKAASVAVQPDAWECFKAAWPWQDGQSESVDAAKRAFNRLSGADRELCVKGAEAFQPRPGRVCAAVFIAERHWSFKPRRSPAASSTSAPSASSSKAQRRPDGTWWLAPDSPQLERWHEFERRTSPDRRAKAGCVRPAEWPPGNPSNLPIGGKGIPPLRTASP
ncbi:hypothetical protein [Methylocystis sp. ATCC 49242]|uniref:hypothetical protein n=1 Tax=Methylocystis sp. ATCC 49242 TaxID=622637 RepID=UPI0001F88855|nr:hypothetical protein [Methylocystis sp. ATCC 49242]